MSVVREHGDLHVVLTRNREGRIIKADLIQSGEPLDANYIQLTADQLYALVDDVAVADPERWESRFPPEHHTELALRRVADYFKERAEANRKAIEKVKKHFHGEGADEVHELYRVQADTFDLAVCRVVEEIEDLYPDKDTDHDPVQDLNNYHARS